MKIAEKDIKGSVCNLCRIRHLKKADYKPQIHLDRNTQRPSLTIVRNGYTESLLISRRVAEELISAGFSYGN